MTPTTEYRLIPLTKGQHAIVDAADYKWLSQWKWYAIWDRCGGNFYAVRSIRVDGKKRTIRMHRQILRLEDGDKRQGDHRNNDTLDNRRTNLRIATGQQNKWNEGIRSNNTSGYKGVTWHKGLKRWCAQISFQGRNVHLGYFDTPEKARSAYCEAAAQIHGEFARIA